VKVSCNVSLLSPSPKIPQSFAMSDAGLLCMQMCHCPTQQSRTGREWEKPSEQAYS